ncbi:MAG: hypothetical protein AAFO78_12540 [Pseudomonadota bacterium]
MPRPDTSKAPPAPAPSEPMPPSTPAPATIAPGEPGVPSPASSGAQSLETVKHRDPDQFYALRYLPAAAHRLVCGWLGLNEALARVPASVSTPPLGEIRLQWWREAVAETVAIAAEFCADPDPRSSVPAARRLRAHPVLQDIGHGLGALVAGHAVDLGEKGSANALDAVASALDLVIEARARLLYDPAFTDIEAASQWLRSTDGAMVEQLFVLLHQLTAPATPAVEPATDIGRLIGDGAGLVALARHRAIPVPPMQLNVEDDHVTDYLMTEYKTWRGNMRAALGALDVAGGAGLRPFLLAPHMVPAYARAASGHPPGALTRHLRLAWANLFGQV